MHSDQPGLAERLLWRPTLRHRGGVAYITVRAWRAGTRTDDLALFKAEKAARRPAFVEAVAAEIAAEVRALVFPASPWSVTSVAPGHSRDAEACCVHIARAVALRLGLPYVTTFEPRPVPGSSHPRRNAGLPPLQWRERPAGPVILVDDVATSGWHMAEALGMLRGAGIPALGAAWIGGTAQEGVEDRPAGRPLPGATRRPAAAAEPDCLVNRAAPPLPG
ncbi:hypothetical protein STVA_12120 [Allostella vacuolata]|nr:hypothetical protein STVA_12120 [Stella vacuolata]